MVDEGLFGDAGEEASHGAWPARLRLVQGASSRAAASLGAAASSVPGATMPSRAASAAPSLRAMPGANSTATITTSSQLPDTTGNQAAVPDGYGHTLRYN